MFFLFLTTLYRLIKTHKKLGSVRNILPTKKNINKKYVFVGPHRYSSRVRHWHSSDFPSWYQRQRSQSVPPGDRDMSETGAKCHQYHCTWWRPEPKRWAIRLRVGAQTIRRSEELDTYKDQRWGTRQTVYLALQFLEFTLFTHSYLCLLFFLHQTLFFISH